MNSISEPAMESQIQPAPKPDRGLRKRNHLLDRPCPFCGQKTMQREKRGELVDMLLAIVSCYRFGCRRCFRSATKFLITWRFFAFLLLLAGIGAGAAYGSLYLIPQRQRVAEEASSHVDAAAGVRSNMGQLSPFEKMMLSKHQQTLDNATILKLTRSGIGTNIILKMIRNSNPDFDVSPDAIIALKEAGVDESVIYNMLDLSTDPR